jgi:hypothetical protein
MDFFVQDQLAHAVSEDGLTQAGKPARERRSSDRQRGIVRAGLRTGAPGQTHRAALIAAMRFPTHSSSAFIPFAS